jgi:VWFA-related protein
MSHKINMLLTLFGLIIAPMACVQGSRAQVVTSKDGAGDVTILVTAHPNTDQMRTAAKNLQPDDFSVREDDRPQKVLSIKNASEAPPVIAVLIQDNLIPQVDNEIREIKTFILGLPEGSRVMTGYLTVGSLRVSQDFTTDRRKAAESLRIIRSDPESAPYNPYVEVVEALRHYDSQRAGRRLMLLISDGLDLSHGFSEASPSQSMDLDRAVRECQREGVAVYSFYAPSVGLTRVNLEAANFGQGSLLRLSDETGGEAFFTGTTFVSFDPYFKELNALLGRQWILTYHSSNTGSGFHKIKVVTESNVHLHYPHGYWVK